MQTIRHQMMTLLNRAEMTAIELSQILGIPEKEVYGHLPGEVKRLLSLKTYSQFRHLAG